MAESLIHAILKGQYICFEQATLILQESIKSSGVKENK